MVAQFTLPTVTDVEVIPVWSLVALAGTPDPLEPPPDVVVVAVELVELQATAAIASTVTNPAAARRVFRDGLKAPPCLRTQPGRTNGWTGPDARM
jgi:hypothetical protein